MNGAIAWFARNGVAANLLVLVIAAAGLMSLPTIKKEIFPEFSSDTINISVLYPGAAPEEVEEGVCIRIEEAVHGLDGLKRVRSVASEGSGMVTVELLPGTDARKALDEVKNRVDAIDTFPEEAEKPVIQEILIKSQVINVGVTGNVDEKTLKLHGERVRDEIASRPGITQAELVVARPYEVAIEVSEKSLRQYGLTFDEVARAVRRFSLDLPGGTVRTSGGEFLLRVKGQAYRAPDFEKIPLRTHLDGSRLLLGDVAAVVDGFAETDQSARIDNVPAVTVQVFRVGDQNALELAESVKAYVREAQPGLPEGIQLMAYQDYSQYLRSRLNLLVRNACMGFVLVFLLLTLFLRFRLALWVSVGIPVSFLGTFWLMPGLDVSINLLSLFAFLLVLGIVVDDAIVVGENIYTHGRMGKSPIQAAIDGCREVAVPVVFSVLTSVAAFLPMITVPGNTGKVLKAIPLIVVPTLIFSLIESMFCLPHHLSTVRNRPEGERGVNPLVRFQRRFSDGVERFTHTRFRRFLDACLRWRYVTLACGLFTLLVCAGLIAGGRLKFEFFPPVEGDDVGAFLTMPEGTPAELTRQAVLQVEAAALQLREKLRRETGNDAFSHVVASIGDQPLRTAISKNGGNPGESFARPNVGEVHIQLAPSETRTVPASVIANEWRKLAGEIPGAVEVVFSSSLFTSGNAIDVQLRGRDVDSLRRAAEELKQVLAGYPGVMDITDSFRSGKQEIKLDLKPSGIVLGLTLEDLARQVRQAFYGEEAQRIQRGRDEVKVMVRYPLAERRSLGNLESMRVRLPDGTEVPFAAVAEATVVQGYSNIIRVDRQRAINVLADVDLSIGNPNEILADVQARVLPELKERYPSLSYGFEGERREQTEMMGGMIRGFVLALFMIFALIAIPLKSYMHPLVVLTSIPFGFVGAVLGHLLMGMNLTILSMFGLMALSGVAVNDSLVLVDFINRARREGVPLLDAVRQAGLKRFRPIWLTSLTTFAGLTPLIFEKSVQAQFLIPMAISLGFGVLWCTVTSLLLVPAQYLIWEDVKAGFQRHVLRRSTGSAEARIGEPVQPSQMG